jgi:hypothetical protein
MTTTVATDLQTEWLKYAFTTSALAARPTTWVVALHTGDPTQDGTLNEVTVGLDSAYLRKAVTFSLTAGVATNVAAVTFPVTASAYTVAYISVWDGAVGGACLYVGALVPPQDLPIGGTLSFPIGQLALTVQ